MKCCEEYTAALSAFADGELNENERNELLAHLEHCETCRDKLSELMILHTMFEELPELDAPEGFSARVLDRLHAEEHAKKRHRRAWPRVLAACFALLVVTAAAWKLAPAMVNSSDSAADCDTNSNETMGAPTVSDASDASDNGLTYSYSSVQKDGTQSDASPFDTYADAEDGAEDGADDRSTDTEGGYVIVTLDVPAAAEFLHERGMAVYAENDDYVSYLVVAEAAHELADAMELPEAERAALRQADDILIVEVAKTAPAVDERADDIAAQEEGNE